MSGDVAEIEKYEKFLNDVLRPDYLSAVERREKIIDEMRDYESLLVTVATMQKIESSTEKDKKLKTLVNLGKHFFVQAVVDRNDRIVVKLMDGLFAELPLPRAGVFIEEKIKLLAERADAVDRVASQIRAHIDIVLSSLADYEKLAHRAPKNVE